MGRALSTRSCTGRPTSARCPREIPTSHTARRRAEASFNVCSLRIVHRRCIHAVQAFHAVLMRERAFTLANTECTELRRVTGESLLPCKRTRHWKDGKITLNPSRPEPAFAVQRFRITDSRARKSVATPLRLRARLVWQS